MEIGEINLKWLGNASFLIKNSATIYIDPYNINKTEKADIILITHSHYDHCSIPDIQKVAKEGTIIVMPADAQSKITKLNERVKMEIVEPGDELTIKNIKISTIPSYNKNKQFHPKQELWIGYVIKMNNNIIYHAGDTDLIPEMQKLTGYGKQGHEFVALLPIGGKYTMDVDEAIEAAKIIKPTLAIPIHWGSVAGTKEDAENFVKLCEQQNIKAQILEKE